MGDDKKPTTGDDEEIMINGKPLSEADLDDLQDAIDRGDLELPRLKKPELEDTFTAENLEKFILGEITWAQLQGMTMDEAYNIAEYGYALYEESRYHDSRVIFEGLVIANPYDAYFHNMLGAVYQQLDMKEEAAEEYTTAIDLDDENLPAHVNRGELLLQSGDFTRALEDLKRAIELDPNGEDPAGIRARALAMATASALEEVKRVLAEKDKKK